MKTIYLHHFYIPKKAFGCTYLTNFHEEFDNADHEGVEAILETYNRLYDQWKDNSIYIKELMLVLNHRCTYWNNEITKDSKNRKAIKYAQIYWDLFEKMDELLYGPDSYEDVVEF